MRVERVFRLLGLLLGLIAGVEYASFIIQEAKIDGYTLRAVVLMLTALAGGALWFFRVPPRSTKPLFLLANKMKVTPPPELAGGAPRGTAAPPVASAATPGLAQ